MERYLASDAHIWHSLFFEQAICKLQSGNSNLSSDEKNALTRFVVDDVPSDITVTKNLSLAERALSECESSGFDVKYVGMEQIVGWKHIDPKSLKHDANQTRRSSFLKANRPIWDIRLVSKFFD